MTGKIKTLASLAIILLIVLISGCGCRPSASENYKLNLEIWGPLDDSYTFNDIFENYKKINSHIENIEYKKIPYDTYKKEVVDAMASGKGPDIILIHNNWLPGFIDKIMPAPVSTDVMNEQKFRQEFVDVAADDLISSGAIYGAPLSVDSMGLYYNKDLFNAAGIATPPKNWEEFLDNVSKITQIDSGARSGEIIRSGAALGTAYNINRSTDVLAMLMMQSGTNIVDKSTRKITLSDMVINGSEKLSPGENALSFYTQFARTGSPYYSWNPNLHYSVDAFSEGTVGMMFNYSWQIKTIREKAPKLNFAIAPIPQFSQNSPVNYANYWAFSVVKNKIATADPADTKKVPVSNDIRVLEAWKFITFLTSQPPEKGYASAGSIGGLGSSVDSKMDPALMYIQKTEVPSARRDLIEKQKTDPMLGVFASGNLVAKSWYEIDPENIEPIFAEIIDQINKGQITPREAVNIAAKRIANMMQ